MDRDTAEVSATTIPGERARQWVEHHHEHAATATHVYEFVWDVTADSTGPFVVDVDGNVLLDFTSHVGASPLGYDHPRLRERLDAFDVPDPAKFAGQDFYAAGGWPPEDPAFPGPTQLQAMLAERTSQYGLDTVFLSNSGAEAVENAIKICYDHAGGHRAVTFQGAFHGRTLGALSLNRSKQVQRRGFPEIPGVVDVPYCTDAGCTPATCECGFFVENEFADAASGGGATAAGSREGATDAADADDADHYAMLSRMLDAKSGSLPPEEVAYIAIEPIQGEGGYRIPSDPFLEAVADVADEHGIPIVADEIQAGLGRTGEFWAVDHGPIEPDAIAAAKGLRVGATIASEDVFPDEQGRLSSTWGAGDLLASLQGALTLEVIEDEDLCANAGVRGEQLRELLADADLPGATDVRGRGLMIGVEFDATERRGEVVSACLQRGLLVIGCGQRTIRLLPPLDVREREVRIGAELFAAAVRDAASES